MSELTQDQVLPEKSYIINRQLLIAYANASGGDQNPIHQDEAFAKSVGLPDVIAHGMLTMALAGKYLSDISGSEKVVEFSARFIKPVIVPAGSDVMLSVTGKVVEVANGQAKV